MGNSMCFQWQSDFTTARKLIHILFRGIGSEHENRLCILNIGRKNCLSRRGRSTCGLQWTIAYSCDSVYFCIIIHGTCRLEEMIMVCTCAGDVQFVSFQVPSWLINIVYQFVHPTLFRTFCVRNDRNFNFNSNFALQVVRNGEYLYSNQFFRKKEETIHFVCTKKSTSQFCWMSQKIGQRGRRPKMIREELHGSFPRIKFTLSV